MGKIRAAAIYALGILMFLWLVWIGLVEMITSAVRELTVFLWKALLRTLTNIAIFVLTILVGKK